jgi:pSer/pThr/pTyr-binding forkhead associated (FHA) protein
VPITFFCSCGQSMTVADHFAGKTGRCPKCKNPVQVPAAGAAPAPAPAAAPAARPAPVGSRSSPPTGAVKKPAPAAAAKTAGKLQVVNAQSAPSVVNKLYPLVSGKANVIGRDPGVDISIPSDRISRRHCQLEPTADGVFVLTDLGSSNGTLVNQERINGRKVLLGGEYIQIGDVLLRFLDS